MKKENLATTRSFTSNYAGEASLPYILPSIIGGETLSTDGISILTGVKYKHAIKKFSSASIIQSGSCAFNPTGTLTIAEAVLEPKKLKVNAQLCFQDLYSLWDASTMGDGMNDENFPAELESAIITEFSNQTAKEFETIAWQGSATYGITGWIPYLTGNSVVTQTGVTLTSANILTEMNKVINKIPAGVKKENRADLVLFVSHTAAFLYEQNLAAQGFQISADAQKRSLYGIEVKPVGGLGANEMVLGARKNFYVATDLLSDWNQIVMIDQRFNGDGSDYLNFVMRMKADFAVGYANEVVLYM